MVANMPPRSGPYDSCWRVAALSTSWHLRSFVRGFVTMLYGFSGTGGTMDICRTLKMLDFIVVLIGSDVLKEPRIPPDLWRFHDMMCVSLVLRCCRSWIAEGDIHISRISIMLRHSCMFTESEVLEEPWIPPEHWAYNCLSFDSEVLKEAWIPPDHWNCYDVIVIFAWLQRRWRNHEYLSTWIPATWLCLAMILSCWRNHEWLQLIRHANILYFCISSKVRNYEWLDLIGSHMRWLLFFFHRF